ncbi:hypothetical protein BC941DRAFT_467773 [Chlamydoabsidia padenii]|nr:hypothetical protein BC941DRAFT_467773 [Chlamydoabsidia padenii]
MNSEENHAIEDNSPTELQDHASDHPKKHKFALSRVFGGIKEFIDKGKTDAVRTEPPPITRQYSH